MKMKISKKARIAILAVAGAFAALFVIGFLLSYGVNGGSLKGQAFTDDVAYGGNYESADQAPQAPSDASSGSGDGSSDTIPVTGQKFIQTASVSMETLDFDAYLANFEQLLAKHGAYLEEDARGTRYSGSRYMDAVVRVPDADLDDFLAGMSEGGSVMDMKITRDDVTLEYSDAEARRDMLKAEQEWLMDALSSASDLQEMMSVRDRLTDVNYELESAARRLRVLDNLIGYATVNFSLTEVVRLTEEPEGFLDRIRTGLKENWEDTVEFVGDVLVWAISHVFSIVLFAIAAFAAVKFVGWRVRKRRARKAARIADKSASGLDDRPGDGPGTE